MVLWGCNMLLGIYTTWRNQTITVFWNHANNQSKIAFNNNTLLPFTLRPWSVMQENIDQRSKKLRFLLILPIGFVGFTKQNFWVDNFFASDIFTLFLQNVKFLALWHTCQKLRQTHTIVIPHVITTKTIIYINITYLITYTPRTKLVWYCNLESKNWQAINRGLCLGSMFHKTVLTTPPFLQHRGNKSVGLFTFTSVPIT